MTHATETGRIGARMKKVGGRLLALVTMVIASIIFFLPSYQPLYKELPRWVRDVLPDKGITLGLDLQGGIHLVLEVEEDRAPRVTARGHGARGGLVAGGQVAPVGRQVGDRGELAHTRLDAC